eukprot:COSAG02_NODE_6374_length_3615_cov_3.420648_4_plen_37_part_00
MSVSGSFFKLCRSWGNDKKIVAISDLSLKKHIHKIK